MKITGLDASKVATGRVVIPRGEGEAPLVLTVCGLPLGFEDKLLEINPPPVPPRNPVILGKKPSTGAPLYERDARGKTIYAEDKNDPEFLKATRDSNRIFSAFYVYHGLRKEGSVSWIAKPEAEPRADFYHAIWAEMEESGLSSGDVLLIVQKIMELSNFNKEKIEAATADFLSSETER